MAGKSERKWAPWYVYVVILVVCNQVKQYFLQDEPVVVNAVVTVVLLAGLFALITVVYRGMAGSVRR